MVRRPVLLLLALIPTTLDAQSAVHVVDASGAGGATASLPQAVFAASPGDTLLIKSGTYASLLLSKPLTVVADEGATVRVSYIQVADLPAGTHAVIRGLDTDKAAVANCDGVVWLEDLTCHAGYIGADGLRVISSNVVVVSSRLVGAPSVPSEPFPWGEYGLSLWFDSTVHVYDSIVVGGAGHPAFAGPSGWDGADGGAGIYVQSNDSQLLISDSLVLGGRGGAADVSALPCGAPGDGGDGLHFQTVGSSHTVNVLGTSFQGGLAGLLGTPTVACSPPAGSPGQDVYDPSGIGPTSLGAAVPLRVTASSPVRETKDVLVDLLGPPGAPVLLAIGLSGSTPPLFLPSFSGSLMVMSPFFSASAGALDGAGFGQLGLPAKVLPVGMQAHDFFLQAAYVLGGGIVLGEPSVTTLLDGAF